MSNITNDFPLYSQAFMEAYSSLKRDIEGICITQDPARDWKALKWKNDRIIGSHGFVFEELFTTEANGDYKIELRLVFKLTGEVHNAVKVLKKQKHQSYSSDDSKVLQWCRILYELLFGIVCSNDPVEAQIYGPIKFVDDSKKTRTKTFIDPMMENLIGARREAVLGLLGLFLPDYSTQEVSHRTFSWSDIGTFLRCPRCFYSAKKLEMKLDSLSDEAFALEKQIDSYLKRDFDRYRNERKLHPIMVNSEAVRLLKHEKLSIWREPISSADRYNKGGIQYHDAWSNLMVYGGVDDVWVNDRGEFIIVDYKATVKNSVKVNSLYKKQLEFYAWIFKKNNYPVSLVGYILFCKLQSSQDFSNWMLNFELELMECALDDSWVEETINNALICLDSTQLPKVGKKVFSENSEDACYKCKTLERWIKLCDD